MKLPKSPFAGLTPFALLLVLLGSLSLLAGCDDASTNHVTEKPADAARSVRDSAADSSRLGSIRSRADDAFASLARADSRADTTGATRSRRESRIGPQPWPRDLPNAWPRLENAQVLADTRRDGDRLLLVDVPADAEQAAGEFEDALRDQGYRVDPLILRAGHALHAESDDHEVVLTFFAREKVTRLEILFPGKRAS